MCTFLLVILCLILGINQALCKFLCVCILVEGGGHFVSLCSFQILLVAVGWLCHSVQPCEIGPQILQGLVHHWNKCHCQ